MQVSRFRGRSGEVRTAAALFAFLFVLYNLNGREIGSYDTQSTKFAARELLRRGTFSLNHVVGQTPQYASRWGFILAADGHYRSVYSPAAPLAAAILNWPLVRTGMIDIRSPLAPALMAKLTASTLVAFAVVLAYFTARRRLVRRQALLVAIGLGCGTGLWSTASQTLWQTETVLCGLALAILLFDRDPGDASVGTALVLGLGLGVAGAARSQVAPIIVVLLAGTAWRYGWRQAAVAASVVALFAAAVCVANMRWYGDPLGPLSLLGDVNANLHRTAWWSVFSMNPEGFVGLLVSPNRGLFIFSPIVLIAMRGIGQAADWRSPLRWLAVAAAAQYALYATYAVWWGGHTYGPRYLIDLLPLLVPLSAAALARPVGVAAARFAAAVALAWSVVAAGTGAWCYPHDGWNSDPDDVDTHHERLWDWQDSQIVRCWTRGPSPQNFDFFSK